MQTNSPRLLFTYAATYMSDSQNFEEQNTPFYKTRLSFFSLLFSIPKFDICCQTIWLL